MEGGNPDGGMHSRTLPSDPMDSHRHTLKPHLELTLVEAGRLGPNIHISTKACGREWMPQI